MSDDDLTDLECDECPCGCPIGDDCTCVEQQEPCDGCRCMDWTEEDDE